MAQIRADMQALKEEQAHVEAEIAKATGDLPRRSCAKGGAHAGGVRRGTLWEERV
jgi:hypothetical protein